MNTSLYIRLGTAALMLSLTGGAYAGDASKTRGTVTDALNSGFKFVGGSELSPDPSGPAKETNVQYNTAFYRSGSVYLVKESQLLVCTFNIVEINNSSGHDFMRPGSTCYEIK